MKQRTKKAYAKINLGLDVIRRMENGYHEVKMIMQTVDIFDVLTFTQADCGIKLAVNQEELPVDEHNLIYKAAKLLLEDAGCTKGVDITLEKNIPIAAGMAGGSSDAAATLTALNELFELGYSIEKLKELAVQIGADVPYCIEGGTALSEGIGEKLTKLSAPPHCILVVAKPDVQVSTKFVYENLQANNLSYHPDIDGMIGAIEKGDLQGVVDRLGNVLETVTLEHYKVVQSIKDEMMNCGALGALMSGSGPTVFGMYEDVEAAQYTTEQLIAKGYVPHVFVTSFVQEI
ncbi:MAG: 4-(cytidine 5'-diphospho)-2-C-methyl-D-erythritol kinase [Lachnospiraceae bacterium]